MMKISQLLGFLAILSLAACASNPLTQPGDSDSAEVTALRHAILALGDGVDPEEAERAARIASTHIRHLAREYRFTDPPLIHNAKVHMGLRDRGLCYHWAEDIEARLQQEDFRTLELHRAISPETLVRLEHSTTIISRKGDNLFDGVILDPWRAGGTLFWIQVRDDASYDWRPKSEVLATRRQSSETRRQLLPVSR